MEQAKMMIPVQINYAHLTTRLVIVVGVRLRISTNLRIILTVNEWKIQEILLFVSIDFFSTICNLRDIV